VRANQDEEASEREALQEVFELLDLLLSLGEGALRQPRECQPKAPPNNPYRTSNPTKYILPQLRTFHRNIGNELRELKRASTLAAYNEQAGERQQRQEMLERKREQENRRIIEEKSQAGKNHIGNMLRADPRLNRLVQLELKRQAELQIRAAERQTARSAQLRQHGNSQQVSVQHQHENETFEDEDDPFREDEEERVMMLPGNNKLMHETKPLTNAERDLFIDIMQHAPSMFTRLRSCISTRTDLN
jgi:hypothetical protein